MITAWAVGASAASAQEDAPYELEAPIPDSALTQIMVLGTEHLRELGDDFDPSLVASLLDVLEGYGPDVIAIESLPPGEIARLASDPDPTGARAQVAAAFAADPIRLGRAAQDELGLTRAQASAAVDSLLEADESGVAARRLLVKRMLAEFDLPSAVLQWLSLPSASRVAGGEITASEATELSALASSANEIYAIAIPLALRMGHDRVASVDDHTDDEVGLSSGYYEALQPALEATDAYRALTDSEYLRASRTRLPEAAATGDLLPMYVEVNSPSHLNEDVAAQWHLFFRTHLSSGFDRARVALWETRNLRMAAHLRSASAFEPGGRMLLVVGAAHKPFLDRYLDQMMDVRVVHLAEFMDR